MDFKLELYTTSWVDVSDYVINSLSVPFIKRNKDFSISAEGFFLYLSENISSSIVNNASEVKFYVDSSVKFHGVIKGTYYNRASYQYELTIYDKIVELQDYKIEYDVLSTTLDSVSDSSKKLLYLSGATYYRFYSLPHILDSMFSVAGLTVNTNDLYTTTKNIVTSKSINGTSYNFKTRELMLNQNMLYCINQNYACSYSKISSNDVSGYNFEDYKITLFDFVSFVCSICGLYFTYENGLYLKQLSTYQNYTSSELDNDYLFDRSEDKTEAESSDYKLSLLFASLSNYYSTSPTAVYPNYTKNDEGVYINWYNNLIFGFYAGSGSLHPFESTNYLRPVDLDTFYLGDSKTLKGGFAEIETAVKVDARNIVENIIILTPDSQLSKIVQGYYSTLGLVP